MTLRFSANIGQLPNLQLSCVLSRAFSTVAGAVAGTATACLFVLAWLAVLPSEASARQLHVFHDSDRFKFESASVAEGESQTIRITKKVEGIVTLHYWNQYKTVNRRCCASATIGVDVANITESAPGEVSFPNAAGVQRTITVNSTEDTVVELDEEYELMFRELAAVPRPNGTRARPAYLIKIKILNDDQAKLEIDTQEARWEGLDLVFDVTLHKALPRSLTVTPRITYGTATAEDVTANLTALTFAGYATETKTVTVGTVDDSLAEGQHQFTVNLVVTQERKPWAWTNADGRRNLSPFILNEGTGIIWDNEISLSVPENSPGGTSIGGPGERSPLQYSLSGSRNLFTIDSATGVVSVVQGADLDHERTSSHTSSILLGPHGGGYVIELTINVTDVDEPPAKPDAPTLVKTSATTMSVSWLPPSNTGPRITDYDVRYRKGDATDWTEHDPTCTCTSTFIQISGLEDGAVYEVQVMASNDEGDSPWSDPGVTHRQMVITNPGDKTYVQGETITSFGITVSNPDGEEPDTDVLGLPSGLSYANNQVQGTVANDADTKDYKVGITAFDGEFSARESFTVTVNVNDPPTITNPGNKTYAQGEAITPFGFTVTDENVGRNKTPTVEGLPNGLSWGFDSDAEAENSGAPFKVQGTVAADAEVKDYTVTITMDDGVNAAVTTTFTITVTEAVAVTIEDASANEGDSITFTVTLNKAVAGGLTVTPSFTDGTATEGTDYTENTTTLNFAGTAGETKTFTVATIEDTVGEVDETFTVGLAVSGTTATVTASDTATGTILDDEAPAVTIGDASAGSADVSASEGDAMTFTVRLDKAVAGGLTVTPSFTDGTATKGTDYTENTTTLNFAGTKGETKTFTVATIEDTVGEVDETFTVGLSVSGTTATVTDTVTGTILDDEAPAVTIGDASAGSADVSASEGDSMTFTVRLDKAVAGGLTVTPSFTDGTATKGTDYTENTTALTFTGTAGETKTFTVVTIEDTVGEVDETFTVGLSVSGTTATVTATDTVTGTILDDEAPAVTIGDVSASEGDSMTFTVRLDKAVPGGLWVTPSFTDGTATKGTDYTENTTTLNFAGTKGETKTFTVATIEDTVGEVDETFTVGLSVSGTTATVTATDTVTGTILDDEAPAVTIGDASAGSADVSASEGDSMTFTVRLDKAVAGGLTVTPSFTDGTATEGTDYTENTTALTFTGTAGEAKTFTVATIEDTVGEPDETFTVSLTVSGTTETVTATDTVTGTILDDDETAPAVTIGDASAGTADVSASEGDAMTFTVRLDKAVAGGLTVTPSFTDGTATEGTDYTENTTALTFTGTAGETKTFTVATIEDTVGEPDETFTVSLTVSGTTETVTATDTVTGTILDDDETAPAVTIGDASAGTADVSASEGDAMTFTVRLDKAVADGLTVTPSFTDGTATEGTDYTENTTALTFTGTAGEAKTFTVATIEDTVGEPDETFTVSLTVSGTTETVTATDTVTGTILDDEAQPSDSPPSDPPPSDPSGNSPPEPRGEMPKQILLVGASATIDSEPYFVDPDGDPLDYDAKTDAPDIATAVTSSPPVTTTAKTKGMTTVTVKACDPHGECAEQDFEVLVIQASISFVPDSLTVPEGDMKSYTVALQAEPAGPVTVTLTSEDPEAAMVLPTELTFTPGNWNTRQRVHVTGVHDDDTDDELVTVTHATSGGGYHVTADFMVTVLDDDTPGVTITPTEVEVDEGVTAAGAYTVVLDTKPKGAVTVTPVSGDAGTVTVSSQTLTFTPATWNRPQAVSLTSVRDQDATDETVAVHHEVSGADYAGVTADSVRVRVLDKEGAARRRMAEHWLARFGRTVATDVVDVVGDRFAAPPGESHVTVNGQRLDPGAGEPSDDEEEGDAEQGMVAVLGTILEGLGVTGPQSEQGAPGVGLPFGGLAGQNVDIGGQAWPSRDGSLRLPSGREVLTNSAFSLSLNGDRSRDSENWTLWGLGRVTRFQARPEDGLSLDGEVVSGHLGADYRWSPRSLAGVVVSHAMGRGDFDGAPTYGASVIADNIKSSLTSVHPYVRWTPSEGLDLWGILGFGLGKMEMEDSLGRAETDIAMRMAALGVRNTLVSVGRFDLALKADAFAVEMESDDVSALRSTSRDVERLRLMLEGQTEWAASADSRLVPSMELGVRYDGGDAEQGGGAELGGGLAYVHTALGLTVEARGRLLLAHRENDFKQWGASVMANLAPDASGEGLSFSLAPSWGAASSGLDNLWSQQTVADLGTLNNGPGGGLGAQALRVNAQVGYGMWVPSIGGLVTPFTGVEVSDQGLSRSRVGLMLNGLHTQAGDLGVQLAGEHREMALGQAEQLIGLQVQLQFGSSGSNLPIDQGRGASEQAPAVRSPSIPDKVAFVPKVRGPEPRTHSARFAPLVTGSGVAGKNHGTIRHRAAIQDQATAQPRTTAKSPARAGHHVKAKPRTSARHAATAETLSPASDRRYFVQLGAFSQHANAVRARTQLTGELSGVLRHHNRRLAVVASQNGGLTRILFAHAFRTRHAAASLCAAIKARGPDCYVTVARPIPRPDQRLPRVAEARDGG